jgi:hypothetical protein
MFTVGEFLGARFIVKDGGRCTVTVFNDTDSPTLPGFSFNHARMMAFAGRHWRFPLNCTSELHDDMTRSFSHDMVELIDRACSADIARREAVACCRTDPWIGQDVL